MRVSQGMVSDLPHCLQIDNRTHSVRWPEAAHFLRGGHRFQTVAADYCYVLLLLCTVQIN